MSSIKLPDGEYTIRTLDGRVLAYPFIVKPDLGVIIIPPPPRPVYALPSTLQPERFLVTLMDPERRLYQISALVDDDGRLVEWIVSPQRWVLTFVPEQDAYLAQDESLGSGWAAPKEGKFGQVRYVDYPEPLCLTSDVYQVHVNPVPWNAQTVLCCVELYKLSVYYHQKIQYVERKLRSVLCTPSAWAAQGFSLSSQQALPKLEVTPVNPTNIH
ncbi:hypothetical protein EDD15DRAFT_1640879 [Pisolithus albus]|nr:hypothetical protein EDD15DRAFT_1640879 [Pisolithus albus]